MRTTYTIMRNRHQGFTLIEVMIVVAIIGILASIAIPQYAVYRQRAFDSRAQADLKNVATAEEAYFVDTSSYISCDENSCPTLLIGLLALSGGVQLQITASVNSFVGTSTHPQGTGKIFNWNQ